jgi:DNA-binding transcriptional LysR family regulator
MIDWDDARYFLAIHRAGSLSSAASRLKVNPSTVGRRLETLEERLGVRVFLRTRDGYSISPAGEQLLPRAERIEEEVEAIGRELVVHQQRLTGLLRVTSSDALGPRVVAPILAEFSVMHPGIDIELDADNRLLSLTKRESDLAVRFVRPHERYLVARRLADYAAAAYCAETYIARRGHPRPPFEGHDFICDNSTCVKEARWVVEQAARGGRIVVKTGSTHVQVAMALGGAGIAMLPCYVGDREPGLVRLGPPEPSTQQPIWLVMHKDLQQAPRVRACADFLVARFAVRNDWLSGQSARGRRGTARVGSTR